ncbi:hypothetical protein HDU98_010324 [Podochytrium sp. JEL0797]|nr:hypothetical protein HDU98_010324 [Podochytrium sp. JEL0797]
MDVHPQATGNVSASSTSNPKVSPAMLGGGIGGAALLLVGVATVFRLSRRTRNRLHPQSPSSSRSMDYESGGGENYSDAKSLIDMGTDGYSKSELASTHLFRFGAASKTITSRNNSTETGSYSGGSSASTLRPLGMMADGLKTDLLHSLPTIPDDPEVPLRHKQLGTCSTIAEEAVDNPSLRTLSAPPRARRSRRMKGASFTTTSSRRSAVSSNASSILIPRSRTQSRTASSVYMNGLAKNLVLNAKFEQEGRFSRLSN